jgi:hypothetical protein
LPRLGEKVRRRESQLLIIKREIHIMGPAQNSRKAWKNRNSIASGWNQKLEEKIKLFVTIQLH